MKNSIKNVVFAIFLMLLPFMATACVSNGGDEPSSCGAQVEIRAEPNDPEMGEVTGGGVYWRGAHAMLTAVPKDGYLFVKWSDGYSNEQRVEPAYESKTFTAIFEPIPPPTGISYVVIDKSFIWGEENCLDPERYATVHYDNGTLESVKIGDLEISGISTAEVGTFKMSIKYGGFECTEMYSVSYASMESELVTEDYYLLDEEFSVTGFVTVYGEGGLSKRLSPTDPELKIEGFDSTCITYDEEKKEIGSRSVTVKVDRCPGAVSYSYSVWYTEAGAVFTGHMDLGEYRVEASSFFIDPSGSFTMDLVMMKKSSIGWLTEDIYKNGDGVKYFWKQNESDPEKIELYTKKNYISKEVNIGYFNSKSGFLTLDASIFDGTFINIVFDSTPRIGMLPVEAE